MGRKPRSASENPVDNSDSRRCPRGICLLDLIEKSPRASGTATVSNFSPRRPRCAKHILTRLALTWIKPVGHVRFGSKADMCSAQPDVRFVPIADIHETKQKDRLAAVSELISLGGYAAAV